MTGLFLTLCASLSPVSSLCFNSPFRNPHSTIGTASFFTNDLNPFQDSYNLMDVPLDPDVTDSKVWSFRQSL